MQIPHVMQIDGVRLVFGLDWIPLLGDASAARALARRQRASHQVVVGSPAAAAGLAGGLSRQLTYWSAATLMAHRHPTGTVAWLMALGAECWHVLACHEGVALARADRSYPDRQLACEAIAALRLSYPHLRFLDQAGAEYAASDEAPCLRELAGAAGEVASLAPVRSSPWGRVGVCVLILLAFAAGMAWWKRPPAEVDPLPLARAAWMQALRDALARRPVHEAQGTRELLAAFYRQPVHLAGWALQSLRCEAGGAGQPWRCVGEYRRLQSAADNRSLIQAAPAEWRLDFPSLDRARAHWPVTPAARVPEPQDLPRSGILARDWASALQEILPAFSKLQLEPARTLVLTPPRDGGGREIQRPSGIPSLATRALQVQGPLQSASLLVPLGQSVSWQKAVLHVQPGARAGLRTSRLILHLEGVVYESA